MRKKLLATYIITIAVTVIVTVIFSWTSVNSHFYEQAKEESVLQVRLLEQILAYDIKNQGFEFQTFAEKYSSKTALRITIIDYNGVVVADSDSDPATMENHKYREEFKEALNGTEQSSLRYSNTISTYSFYYAIPLNYESFDGALRISIPVANIERLVWDLVNSVIIGLVIGFLLAAFIAYFIAGRFMAPIDELTKAAQIIASGDYDQKVYIDNKDQIGDLADAFNRMTFTLRKNIWETEAQNAELEAILTSMDTGLAAIDDNYKIILNNEPFCKLLKIENDIEGKIFYEVTRNPIVFQVIEKSVDEDEYISEEAIINQNGQEVILRISSTPIKGKYDRSIHHGVLLAIEDITTLRKLENVRRDFVSNVTHELKTPLTSIKGFVEALKKGDIDDPEISGRFLDIIDIETDRLTVLIEDILMLSEIETMRLDKSTGSYNIANIVNEVCEILINKAREKDIDIQVEIQDDLDNFHCNRDRIKQLLINLVDNSIKYTEEGSIKIICESSRGNDFLYITIKDTGIGIEEEHLERLFERFYRVDKGRSRKMGGTGLGLSIVKHIVELYNGTIEVKSIYGKGTCMKVRLPFSDKK